ncbi:hypothetical protein ACVIHD_002534 [Bradyrhizobium embrapense]
MFFCYLAFLLLSFGSLLAKCCVTVQRFNDEPVLWETESRGFYEADSSTAVYAIISNRRAIRNAD